jgi:hypothetical protein
MSKILLDFRTARNTIASLLIVSSEFLIVAFPSTANEIREPATHFANCTELQDRLNGRYNPEKEYKRFEESKLMRIEYDDGVYLLYCNGGILVNRTQNTVCRGHIAYSWSRRASTARYYSYWGESRNEDDGSDVNDYCRPLKKLRS